MSDVTGAGPKADMQRVISVRKCSTLDEFRECVSLQRKIWAETDLEIEPATMFVVAAHTGGQVLGAFDGDKLVAYTLAVVGLHHATPYLHSHHTGVHPDYRDRGIGRMLKLFQRDEALSREIRLIQWTFDPLELRNAHFNFNRLGAIARTYHPDLYGVTTSPLHRGLATDRLVAEWHLDSPRVIAAIGDIATDVGLSPAFASIEVPSELEHWKVEDLQRVRRVQQHLREEFSRWFARGYAAIRTRKTSSGTAYVLVPWSDF
jgi:predicted GNAT superfamily acetyltransferase